MRTSTGRFSATCNTQTVAIGAQTVREKMTQLLLEAARSLDEAATDVVLKALVAFGPVRTLEQDATFA
ncbi:hypothetical protein [Rhizobium bangladeshense]|uniref:hypothetical protein n=1 Tax=Rhizobium bangladeshense TaxID=1138189 RepID=UPI0007E57BCD|nr:hypothetical protein [Rhizobium bangladeshense]